MQPLWCPVHERQRKLCTEECAAQRQQFARLRADYRQYWYDRRRGVRPAPFAWRRRVIDTRPVWQAWGLVA